MELAEQQFGTGLIYKKPQSTDRVFMAGNSEPVDWQKGYDVEDELRKKLGSSFKLPINNQYQTQSCVGQAWAKYAGVKKVMGDLNPNWVEFSPRDIYSHIFLPNGGSYIIQGGLFCRNGVLPNEQLPPYWSGKPNTATTEEIMRDRGLEGGKESGDNADPHIYDGMRQLVKGGSVEYVNEDMESVAKAIRDNHGCIIGVYGENNGTWTSKFPKTGIISWGHALYAKGYQYINGKKYIKVINSWGNIGENGCQWLGEEWFNPWYLGGAHTWNPNVGDIVRIQDLETLYQRIEKDWFNSGENYSEHWDDIMKTSSIKVPLSDFENYAILRKLM